MPRFASYDGTEISYRVAGDGPPLVCLPGGPGRAAGYLGDLGGLSQSRRLILLDPRGVGSSDDPVDPATLGVNRLVTDVERLRAHLGLDRMDLLAHSAGAILATLYAAAFPERLSALCLITPSLAAVGVSVTVDQFEAVAGLRADEPWYPVARAAMNDILAGDLSIAAFGASRPLFYARWDAAAREHAMSGIAERHAAAREGYFAAAELDVPATTAVMGKLPAPVLLYTGDLDPLVTPAMARQAAEVFADASVMTQPAAGHFPWVDDPQAFSAAITAFLTRRR
jgi:pimeloyl-ACP methyl ester carboxylesterase